MDSLKQYKIPLKGLSTGRHRLHFQVNSDFFKFFEDPVETRGDFEVQVDLDKESDHYVLQYGIEGYLETTCDRCMADIRMPVRGAHDVILKYGDQRNSDDEIEFLAPNTTEFNIAEHIFEFVRLSVPIVKVFDCDPERDCDLKTLGRLGNSDEEENDTPFRSVLGNLNL
jgi:uncharacterized protein